MKTLELYNGDCLEVMRNAPDSSIDAIVTDPPYGLSFMGKKWDYDVPSVEIWKECLRVLKPGGHLLAFGGTRTYHRLAVNVEDAGFEIRDQIQWLYGQGFPKSLDVSKAIDKAAGAERPIIGSNPNKRAAHVKGGAGFDKGLRGNHHFECVISPVSTGLDAYGNPAATQCHQDCSVRKSLTEMHVTAPATDSAKQWEGWGTALKPANEPIVLARKPLEKGLTVAQNVQKWGTGAINIDGSRIGNEQRVNQPASSYLHTHNTNDGRSAEVIQAYIDKQKFVAPNHVTGRFPANVILDEEAAKALDEQTGELKSGKLSPDNNVQATTGWSGGSQANRVKNTFESNSGGASRFFYVAKASTSERNGGLSEAKNIHPTVKPVKLMEYLVRLITPPNGIVLDPFMGSGTTGIAASNEGVGFIGIELSPEYFTIAENRINGATEKEPVARPISG